MRADRSVGTGPHLLLPALILTRKLLPPAAPAGSLCSGQPLRQVAGMEKTPAHTVGQLSEGSLLTADYQRPRPAQWDTDCLGCVFVNDRKSLRLLYKTAPTSRACCLKSKCHKVLKQAEAIMLTEICILEDQTDSYLGGICWGMTNFLSKAFV